MRTTVELDPDVAAKLRDLAYEHGTSFDQALNSALRSALMTTAAGSKRRYQLASRRLGLRRGVELERALPLAGELEDSETIRKFELGK